MRPASPTPATAPLELPLRLVLVFLLLRPLAPWAARVAILALAMGGLLSPRLLLAPPTWLALALLTGASVVTAWPLPDNHIYLLAYFCAAAAIALAQRDAQAVLTRSSRLLLGLAFAFAVLWKGVLSPDYRDGRFFRVTLLTDERFAETVRLFGGLTPEQLRANREYLIPLPAGAELVEPRRLTEPKALRRLASLATWGTLCAEAALAALFLLPRAGPLEPARHALLLFFCAVTYAFAPVAGFGWLLLVMGLVPCRPEQTWLRGAYVALFFLILFYTEVPWAAMALDWRAALAGG